MSEWWIIPEFHRSPGIAPMLTADSRAHLHHVPRPHSCGYTCYRPRFLTSAKSSDLGRRGGLHFRLGLQPPQVSPSFLRSQASCSRVPPHASATPLPFFGTNNPCLWLLLSHYVLLCLCLFFHDLRSPCPVLPCEEGTDMTRSGPCAALDTRAGPAARRTAPLLPQESPHGRRYQISQLVSSSPKPRTIPHFLAWIFTYHFPWISTGRHCCTDHFHNTWHWNPVGQGEGCGGLDSNRKGKGKVNRHELFSEKGGDSAEGQAGSLLQWTGP